MPQTIFKRYETKYMVTTAQYEILRRVLWSKTTEDQYGDYTITNLYYDTDDFALARASIEKPVYKEKLRLRCYGTASGDATVFLELKKKYKGVVYKRRISLLYDDAMQALCKTEYKKDASEFVSRRGAGQPDASQIEKEIATFLAVHPVSAKAFISYDRVALSGAEDAGLRVTFDRNIRFRREDLRLDRGIWGKEILEPGKVLMEIKTEGAMPLWLCRTLGVNGIFPSSYSKYGTCYTDYILNEANGQRRELIYA
ncbi:MAG: polyphosphate polymerase domain-containing protein [Oscillospiraceae bacterium]|nr:polyphosphate polymerase domain-containing protein [Oscillospiraceae bacterium]